LRKYPTAPQIHYISGTMVLANDSDKALEEWNAELAISPEHPQALVSIAAEYLKRGEYQRALPYAERAVEASPNYFAAHAILGQVLRSEEHTSELQSRFDLVCRLLLEKKKRS